MPLPDRPVLKPALRRVWRDDTTLQLGLAPPRAVVLEGVGAADGRVLALLDGRRDVAALVSDASAAGCPPQRVTELLALLAAADALDEAPPVDPRLAPDELSLSLLHAGPGAARRVLAARGRAMVTVYGAGRVGASVATLLAAAGVGAVTVVDDGPVRPADVSPGGIREQQTGSRAAAARASLPRRGQPAGRAGAGRPDRQPALAIVAPVGPVPDPEVLLTVRRRPHLLVAVQETTAVVGPLVRPGRTPCVRCVHLNRADRDPRWAVMSAQLAGARRADDACDVVLATLAAALAVLQALAVLDRPGCRPATVGGVLELDLADGRLRRRSVVGHPGCGCGAADPGATMEA